MPFSASDRIGGPLSRVIDIMLPYYGDVDLMKAAVESVISQTEAGWRLVVIDDGFPDAEPARWFGEMTDPRIIYLRNEANLGANGNYRKAVDLVESEWFVMMGADDLMEPDYLRTVSRAIDDLDVDIIQPGVDVVDEHGRSVRPLADRLKKILSFTAADGGTVLEGETVVASLLRANWAYFPSLVWRTATVRRVGFRNGLDVVQDLALILDILAGGGRMAILPERVFRYRRHSGSDSSVRALDGRRFDEERRFFSEESDRFAARGWGRAARAGRWRITSRLNAASLIPKAITKGGSPRALAAHVFG
ncbi:glycosyltransferase family 2 protein [Microbacterium aurum]|jgi:glycosyltransferase involved in cell wall biosynthesis|uniref:glycosyltransferase family 2 protein n=1 Tax=Microbacterium aurum TaxID=36805 RepID=UPI0028E31099|nr:glycosyltransferase family 2 protein [Microbacterium aurum]